MTRSSPRSRSRHRRARTPTAAPRSHRKHGSRSTNSATEALKLGHNYVGTEHYLLSLLSGASVGGLAAEVLQTAGVTYEATMARVVQMLSGYMQKP